jgi:hypothetical protein
MLARREVTCKIIHGFVAAVGVGANASVSLSPDVNGPKCPEDLAPFSFTEKFFSVGPFGGSGPTGNKLPSSISLGKSWGGGVGMIECFAEPL